MYTIFRPPNPEKYFMSTEHAVRLFYAGLAFCWHYSMEAMKHWDISLLDEPTTEENKKELRRFVELFSKYFDLKLSEATFAGSIFQIAAMGIKYFSRNEIIPDSCKDIVGPNTPAVAFCIGEEKYGLPIGLIIYAARNQYNQWDERLGEVTLKVFDKLSAAFDKDVFYDPLSGNDDPTIATYVEELLVGVLGWNTYERYIHEMRALLSKAYVD